jgi:hypothetical protein
VGKGSGNGTTRGDRKRNARRERLRALLPRGGAVIGIDLAEDKQALAVVDHDVRVLARKTVKVKAFRLGEALDWAVAQAKVKGLERVTVACEPTGPRWMQVQRLCGERGLPLVCVQPLVSHIAREQQDYTTHKTDESDCVMIARLALELHCYIPEELDETWAHLRHLGAERQDRRAGVVLEFGAGPVGQPGRQLRRRAVVHAVVRCPGQHLPGHRQPRPAVRYQGLPVGEQPARPRTCTPTRW